MLNETEKNYKSGKSERWNEGYLAADEDIREGKATLTQLRDAWEKCQVYDAYDSGYDQRLLEEEAKEQDQLNE